MNQDLDVRVENALLKRALGYDYTETRYEETDKGSKTVKVTRHQPADPRAAIFWLKNRRPDKWSDKQLLEHEGSVNIDDSLDELSTEELMQMVYGDEQ